MKPGMQIMSIDDLGARRRYVGAYCDNGAVADVHIAARKLADRRIHGQHISGAHDEFATRGQRQRHLIGRLALPGSAGLRTYAAGQQACCTQRGDAGNNSAPVEVISSHPSLPMFDGRRRRATPR
jgi:hypothetical protein